MAVVMMAVVVVLRRLGHRDDVLVYTWFWCQSRAEPEDERRAYTLKSTLSGGINRVEEHHSYLKEMEPRHYLGEQLDQYCRGLLHECLFVLCHCGGGTWRLRCRQHRYFSGSLHNSRPLLAKKLSARLSQTARPQL